MMTRLLRACCLLGSTISVMAGDTIIMAPPNVDPNTVDANIRIHANWRGGSYEPISVVAWLRGIGDTSANEAWRGGQISYDDAVPLDVPLNPPSGNVTKVVGMLRIDTSRTDWIHYMAGAGFQTITDPPGAPAVALSSLMMCPCPGLDDEAKYLCDMLYEIENGTSGVWIVRPRCLLEDDCPGSPRCVKSYTSCTVDEDCPRYALLGDTEDACLTGISPGADSFWHDDAFGLAPLAVFQLEIEIPVGRCCDCSACLGDLTEEDCEAIGVK